MYKRSIEDEVNKLIKKRQSALLFGPRQVGKTTLIDACLSSVKNKIIYLLQDPETRAQLEKDPGAIIRQIKAAKLEPYVYVDEAQKIPELFDAIQLLLDRKEAAFIITGSSARKLKKKGANLLPGRVKSFRLDPLSWNEAGWIKDNYLTQLGADNINEGFKYPFEKSLVFGSLPGIATLTEDEERKDFLKSYSHIYLEEEIRAEALVRKIGPFSRFLELAANESGTSPNLTKLSMESGVSVPAIKEFYNLLEDTLVIERIDPYLKNARKRILATPRYFFFDIGVRNALARMPLTDEIINTQKGRLFEHAVILELIRRIRALKCDFKLCFWRTSGGAEVDCIIDMGQKVIPIEIKASKKVAFSEIKGLSIFLDEYCKVTDKGYVVTLGSRPEKLTNKITAVPWNYL